MVAAPVDKLVDRARHAHFGLIIVCAMVALAQLSDPTPAREARAELRYLRAALTRWYGGLRGGGVARFLDKQDQLGEVVRIELEPTPTTGGVADSVESTSDDSESPVPYSEDSDLNNSVIRSGPAICPHCGAPLPLFLQPMVIVPTGSPGSRACYSGPALPVFLPRWPEISVLGNEGNEPENVEELDLHTIMDAWNRWAQAPLLEVHRDPMRAVSLGPFKCQLVPVDSDALHERRVSVPVLAASSSIYANREHEDEAYYVAEVAQGILPVHMWSEDGAIPLRVPVAYGQDRAGTTMTDVLCRYASDQDPSLGEALIGRNRPFAHAFPSLYVYAAQLPGANFDELDGHLVRELYRGAGNVSFLGISVPVHALRLFGLVVVLAAQLYFTATFLELEGRRKEPGSPITSPWIALSAGALASFITVATVVAPVGVAAWVFWGAFAGGSVGSGVVAIGAFGVAGWLAVCCLRVWRRMRSTAS